MTKKFKEDLKFTVIAVIVSVVLALLAR